MEVNLLVVEGKSAGRIVPVAGPKFFIGRAPGCHLRPASSLVSRHHCVILTSEGVVSVRDFGSTNGTLVNGERIRGERELKDGDRLTVGSLEFEVRLVTDAGPKEQPGPESVRNAAVRTLGSPPDDDLDLTEWLGETDVSAAAKPGAETKTPDAAGGESVAAGEAQEEAPEESQDQPARDVSEDEKEQMRRGRDIPGVSKAAQARRVTETPQDAASDALRKFYR